MSDPHGLAVLAWMPRGQMGIARQRSQRQQCASDSTLDWMPRSVVGASEWALIVVGGAVPCLGLFGSSPSSGKPWRFPCANRFPTSPVSPWTRLNPSALVHRIDRMRTTTWSAEHLSSIDASSRPVVAICPPIAYHRPHHGPSPSKSIGDAVGGRHPVVNRPSVTGGSRAVGSVRAE